MNESSIRETADSLLSRLKEPPEVGIVLGSGLAPLAKAVTNALRIETSTLPNYPASTVVGHEGAFLSGRIEGRPVLLLSGRIHSYEGYDLGDVVLPIRLMALAGVKTLILTNAAGGLSSDFAPGDIMQIEDHLNLQGNSPLRGPNVESFGPRFPDMSAVYDPELRALSKQLASSCGLNLKSGVYASCPGPQYETPAEIRMLRLLGADAVGMSTVPEAIAARHMGLRVLAFSVISNLAAGISPTPLDHEEVVAAGIAVGPILTAFMKKLIPQLPGAEE